MTTIKFSENDFLKKYRYRFADEISVYLNPTPESKVEVERLIIGDDRILDFSIEENYEEYYYPIIRLVLAMKQTDYDMIVACKETAEVMINFRKEYTKGEEDMPALGSAESVMKNLKFSMITDEEVLNMYEELEQSKEAEGTEYRQRTTTGYMYEDANGEIVYDSSVEDGSDTNIEEDSYEIKTLYIMNTTLPISRRLVNKIFKKANVLQALLFVLDALEIKDVMMPKPNNNKYYKEMLIPPMTCLQALSFIDTYYGIFRKGSLIFFDYDRSYIIPYSAKCDVYDDGEKKTTCIIVPKAFNSSNKFAGKEGMIGKFVKRTKKNPGLDEDAAYNTDTEVIDSTTNYIVASMTTVEINDDSVMDSYEGIGETNIIDPDERDITISPSAHSGYGNLAKTLINKSLNPFIKSMLNARKQASNVKLVLTLNDIDIDALKPNRMYNIIFEEKKYKKKFGKKYLLAGCTHQFINDGDGWRLTTRAVFRSVYNIQDVSLPKISTAVTKRKKKKK